MKRNIDKIYYQSFFKSLLGDLSISKTKSFLKINENTEQEVIEADKLSLEKKLALLKEIIFVSEYEHFIIFCQSNAVVFDLYQYLNYQGIPSLYLSGSMPETERLTNLLSFKSNEASVLVCSDSANRGLHFNFNSHIIQFDSPPTPIEMLHRFGRTGRLGKKGKVTSFMTEKDTKLYMNFDKLQNTVFN